jgi:hypothetical protein
MARRTLNRHELRRQSDAAESAGLAEAEAEVDSAEEEDEDAGEEQGAVAAVKRKAKPKAAPKPRKPRKPKVPPRMRARWGVFDVSMKQVALFDYRERADAEAKVAELVAKKNGTFFLQMVKEPMPEPEPADAAQPPRK